MPISWSDPLKSEDQDGHCPLLDKSLIVCRPTCLPPGKILYLQLRAFIVCRPTCPPPGKILVFWRLRYPPPGKIITSTSGMLLSWKPSCPPPLIRCWSLKTTITPSRYAFLFIGGLSCPRSVQTLLTQNFLKLSISGLPYNLPPVSCGNIDFKKA